MHWVRIVNPQYEQSRRYQGAIGEVVGYWGPENSADGRDGYLVELANGEIVGVTEEEVEIVGEPREQEALGEGPDASAGAEPDAARPR